MINVPKRYISSFHHFKTRTHHATFTISALPHYLRLLFTRGKKSHFWGLADGSILPQSLQWHQISGQPLFVLHFLIICTSVFLALRPYNLEFHLGVVLIEKLYKFNSWMLLLTSEIIFPWIETKLSWVRVHCLFCWKSLENSLFA